MTSDVFQTGRCEDLLVTVQSHSRSVTRTYFHSKRQPIVRRNTRNYLLSITSPIIETQFPILWCCQTPIFHVSSLQTTPIVVYKVNTNTVTLQRPCKNDVI